MKRNKRLLEKRRRFIHNYVEANSENMTTSEAVENLSENILFVSKSVIWRDLMKPPDDETTCTTD